MDQRLNQPEKAAQRQIVLLLRSLGAAVYVLGTRRPKGDYQGTRQTAGLPDLLIFLAPNDYTNGNLWIEVKAPSGRLSSAQSIFADYCVRAQVTHLVGGVDVVIQWLVNAHYLRPEQVAHYRHPGGLS